MSLCFGIELSVLLISSRRTSLSGFSYDYVVLL
jgi:hypothetical protein